MNRKNFITKSGLALGGGLLAPYILPSGRLFAKSGTVKADHVVLVMFAGGVRQQESVLGRYLEDSQGLIGTEGNIMANLFEGDAPIKKITYGTTVAGEPNGSEPIPKLLSQSLEKSGLLFPEMRAQSAGHYVGLNTLLTGNQGVNQGLKVRPVYPTIFEYLRKHAGFRATDTWLIGSGIGNSTPLLNSSNHENYGLSYGGNMFAAPVTFSAYGKEILGNAKTYTKTDLEPMYFMKNFLDQTFALSKDLMTSISNTDEEKTQIKNFIKNVFSKQQLGQLAKPPVTENADAINIMYAAEVLREFRPKMLAVNISGVDSCHSNFTRYLQSLHRADHITGWLWQYIQNNIPAMSGNTIFIVAPECGRNLTPNPILDQNDWASFDHSDTNALRVWGLMTGKGVPNIRIGGEAQPVGRLTDIVPTIADIFGVLDDVNKSGFIDPMARSLYQRI